LLTPTGKPTEIATIEIFGKPTEIATIEIFDKTHGLRFDRIASVFSYLCSIKTKNKHAAPIHYV